MLEPQAFIPLSSGGSEAEMIEQQKVKLREERESVTWRFQVVLEDSKDQMDSNGIYTVLQFFHVLPQKNHQLGHFPQIILQDLIRFASPAFPTRFHLAAGSSTSSDALAHVGTSQFDGAQVELTRRSLPRQTKKAEKEDDEKDLVPLGQGNWNLYG